MSDYRSHRYGSFKKPNRREQQKGHKKTANRERRYKLSLYLDGHDGGELKESSEFVSEKVSPETIDFQFKTDDFQMKFSMFSSEKSRGRIGVCPKCCRRGKLTKHHIFPRRHFGENGNHLWLCLGCHRELERFIPDELVSIARYFLIISEFFRP